MASTPVKALHPAENAFSTRRMVIASTEWVATSDRPVWVVCRPSGWIKPMAMMASSPTMNTRVGMRRARAPSPSPRRLSAVMISRMAKHMGTVYGAVDGKDEVS